MGLADLESSLPLGKDGIFCPGFYQLEGSGFRFRDWRRGGHGTVNLHRAIVESCDVYFYQLSMKLGIDRMHEYLSKFGFGVRTGIDMPKERRGVLPNPEWKKRVYKQNWYIGETINASIGQGYTLVTPLQFAQATAIMARNGKIIAPRLVKTTYDPGKNTHESKTPFDVGEVTVANPDNWKKVIAAMHDVVQGQGGTARAASAGAPYQFAGKTGTAQVFTLGRDEKYNEKELARELQDHALFIAFAPLDRPKIAVAIIVEHGGHGGSVAAPIVRKVIDAYLLEGDHDIPRKLP
jgi:penicillin-binding protein 2